MSILRTLSLITVLFCVISCEEDDEIIQTVVMPDEQIEEEITEDTTSRGDIIEEVSSDLILNIIESYPYNEITTPTLKLHLVTEDDFGCINYALVTEQMVNDGNLEIQVLGASLGENALCQTAIGPARASFIIGDGIQKITLSKNGLTDEYLVNINEERVEVTKDTSNFSRFVYPEYYRSPENSFVLLCETLKEDSIVCEQFAELLSKDATFEEFSFPEEGIPIYPNGSTPNHFYKVYLETFSEHYPSFSDFLNSLPYYYAHGKYYKYQNASGLDSAGVLLKSFYQELPSIRGVNIHIIGWNNAQYFNDRKLN